MLSNAACTSQTYSPVPSQLSSWALINGKCLPVEEIVTLGRGPGAFIQVEASQRTVSRLHALLYTDRAGRVFIADTDSRNGTFLNGERLPGIKSNGRPVWHLLRKGDKVSLGGAFWYLAIERRGLSDTLSDSWVRSQAV